MRWQTQETSVPPRWDVDQRDLDTLAPGQMISGNYINMYIQLFMANMRRDFVVVPTTSSVTFQKIGVMENWTSPPILEVRTLRGEVWRPELTEFSFILVHIPG